MLQVIPNFIFNFFFLKNIKYKKEWELQFLELYCNAR